MIGGHCGQDRQRQWSNVLLASAAHGDEHCCLLASKRFEDGLNTDRLPAWHGQQQAVSSCQAAFFLAAIRFIQAIREHCARIGLTPLAYPARPELGLDIRCCVHQRYLILFQPGASSVLVVRILHGSRDLLALFSID